MLTAPTNEFLARELQYSMTANNKGPDTKAITEMLMSRSNQELADTREFYEECKYFLLYKKNVDRLKNNDEK